MYVCSSAGIYCATSGSALTTIGEDYAVLVNTGGRCPHSPMRARVLLAEFGWGAPFCQSGCAMIAFPLCPRHPFTVAYATEYYYYDYNPLCEREVSSLCPYGFTYYKDDGSEGSDSCLYVPPTSTNLWSVAASTSGCPLGSHLLTLQSTVTTTGILPFALSLTTTKSWLGCSQSSTATLRARGWAWLDGSANSNLNCGNGTGTRVCLRGQRGGPGNSPYRATKRDVRLSLWFACVCVLCGCGLRLLPSMRMRCECVQADLGVASGTALNRMTDWAPRTSSTGRTTATRKMVASTVRCVCVVSCGHACPLAVSRCTVRVLELAYACGVPKEVLSVCVGCVVRMCSVARQPPELQHQLLLLGV